MALSDAVYRRMVDEVFADIDAAFADVDPDLAESSLSQGALTIQFAHGRRCIVSPQPPVRQIWMAFRDRAWHFDWDEADGRWLDDRGEGIELFGKIGDIARAEAGVEIRIPERPGRA